MFIQNVIKNPTRSLKDLTKASGVAFLNGAVIEKAASGLCAPGDSSTVRSEVLGISNEAITVGQALTQVPAFDIFENDIWIADTTNNSNAAHTNQRMVLTDSVTVNNTGTDDVNGIVQQVGVFGEPADKKILVVFV